MNLAHGLERSACVKPQKEAVLFQNETATYSQVNEKTNQFANLMKSYGIEKGDRVCIWLPNGLDFIHAFYAILKLGALAVPMNYMFKKSEASYVLKDSGSKLLITDHEQLPIAEAIQKQLSVIQTILIIDEFKSENKQIHSIKNELDNINNHLISQDLPPDAGACILYTSGTTGQPKGVELSHYNLNTNAEYYASSIELTDKDYGCIVTPLSHLLVLMAGLILIFMKGAKFYLFERFSTKTVAEKIRKERINFFIGVPATYYMFLTLPNEEKYDLSSLNICITSGAHMPYEVRQKFEKRYDTVTIQAYGQTETSPVITVDQLSKERRFKSVGHPLPHIDVEIIDKNGKVLPAGQEGEIIARGHCVMKGYWNNPAETERTIIGGWLHTGDIGKKDEDGYLYLLDRMKEMIISGGYNIYPKELENVLYEHPAVLETAVIGIPDERLGELTKAFIVLKEGYDVTDEEIKSFTSNHLASYKKIREVEFMKDIPKTTTGKIMKRKLSDLASNQ